MAKIAKLGKKKLTTSVVPAVKLSSIQRTKLKKAFKTKLVAELEKGSSNRVEIEFGTPEFVNKVSKPGTTKGKPKKTKKKQKKK